MFIVNDTLLVFYPEDSDFSVAQLGTGNTWERLRKSSIKELTDYDILDSECAYGETRRILCYYKAVGLEIKIFELVYSVEKEEVSLLGEPQLIQVHPDTSEHQVIITETFLFIDCLLVNAGK